MTKTGLIIAIVVSAVASHCDEAGATDRSAKVRRDFQREHPCPSTGARTGKCPGYIKDHRVPLCAGGPDSPSNMQWQTKEDAKRKDREERRMCRERP